MGGRRAGREEELGGRRFEWGYEDLSMRKKSWLGEDLSGRKKI